MSELAYLYVTPFFPSPGDWRGAYGLDFVKALKRARPQLRVEVFVPGAGNDYEVDGVRVWRFRERILRGFVCPFLFRKSNERSFLEAVRRSGVAVKDVVACHGNTARFAIYPLALKRFNPQCKTLLHHHDLASFGLNLGVLHKVAPYNAWLFRKLRSLHEQIDCHVFISEASRRSFLEAPEADWTIYDDYKAQMRGPKFYHCRPVKMKSSIILHNGVDTKIFCPSSTPPSSRPFTIGCVGNFETLKDQISLLKAIEILQHTFADGPKLRLTFIGSGLKREYCESYSRGAGISVEFRHEVKHKALPGFYRELDLFVLPSYFEGFGCVYTEAWSCGVPFIACEGSGVEDLIVPDERSKWLCKPKDAENLAIKIRDYIENRWEQKLISPIDIDTLVEKFCQKLGI